MNLHKYREEEAAQWPSHRNKRKTTGRNNHTAWVCFFLVAIMAEGKSLTPTDPPLNKGHPLEGWAPPASWTGAAFGFPMQSQWDYDHWPTPCRPGQAAPPLLTPYPRSGQLWVSNTDSCWDKWVRWLPVPHELLLRQEWAATPSPHHTTFPQISGLDRGGDTLNVYFQNFL